MSDAFDAAFDVERPIHAVWNACRLPADAEPPACRIPGFPSFDGPGCAATIIELEPQRLLRVRKDDEPCAGTEIEIRLGPATAGGWPTRVSIRQSRFAPALLALGDLARIHWRHIVADFHLYLTHDVAVPGTVWGDFGAALRETPIGLELGDITGGFAARCGMKPGDLLLTIGDIRIQSIEQLWTVLPLSRAGAETPVVWVRDGRRMGSEACL